MATIASLNVLLGMNTAGFAKGATHAQGLLTGLRREIAAFKTAAIAGLGSLGIGFGAFEMTKSAFEAANAMGKLSQRTGIGIETLSGLAGAAKLVDVSTDDLTGALEKMLKTIGMAQQGEASSTAALQRLGIEIRDLAGLTPDQALFMISDGLARIPDPAVRAANAMAIFGRGAQRALNLLSQGSAGLAAEIEKIRRLGGIITPQELQRIEAADSAIKKMQITTSSFWRDLAVGISPAIVQIIAGFRLLGGLIKPLFDHVKLQILQIIFLLSNFGKAWELMALEMKKGLFGLSDEDEKKLKRLGAEWVEAFELFRAGLEPKLPKDKGLLGGGGPLGRPAKSLEPTPALAFGTQEAISAIARFRRTGTTGHDPLRNIDANTGKTAKNTESIDKNTKDMIEKLKQLGDFSIVDF